MEYDFRNRTGPPYDAQSPMYGRPAAGAPQPHPMYGQAPGLYPRAGQHSSGRNPPFHHTPSPSSNTGIGIRVAIKPEYWITPPPQLSTQVGDIPRSTFNFDFDLEKKILAEAEKESQNWSRLGLENLPSRMPEQTNTDGGWFMKTNMLIGRSLLLSILFDSVLNRKELKARQQAKEIEPGLRRTSTNFTGYLPPLTSNRYKATSLGAKSPTSITTWPYHWCKIVLLAENMISFYSSSPQLVRNKANVIIDYSSKKQLMGAVLTKKQ
ncbi:hypothetical protein HAX54_019208 [Datura stramonium]|uniref:Uncharacterized protein n=1 Tax=Datura stramonium TaxID=4076 RepID=A0ABS8UQB6_DATST|nr:hypothetical protein [Datura stramonium]